MRKIAIGILLVVLFTVVSLVNVTSQKEIAVIPSETSAFVGSLDFGGDSPYNVRLLILKHCPDNIADIDANQAVEAVNIAASKGLNIESIGNHRINKDGRTDNLVFEKIPYGDLDGLKKFISAQMKVNAKSDDTMIVYTIGHGGGNGALMRLGQRGPLMKILAEAAEENNQRTFWWQLSCHAAASLPQISTLTTKQQELFTMAASSPANEVSYFNTQGKQLKTIFNAMAEKSKEIDPNQDDVITAKELGNFMVEKFGKKRGELLFARSPDETIFGWRGMAANKIPIVDRNGPQGRYPRNHIPVP